LCVFANQVGLPLPAVAGLWRSGQTADQDDLIAFALSSVRSASARLGSRGRL